MSDVGTERKRERKRKGGREKKQNRIIEKREIRWKRDKMRGGEKEGKREIERERERDRQRQKEKKRERER